jgi:ABC-type nitrate/sulfonate/bicarbonate transport system ATPase subunit
MSSHPGQIKEEVVIDLPKQRNLDIKLASEFVQIKRHIIHSLGH